MQVFENAVFLFFTHPFDVGDEVIVDDDRFTVTSITLQYVKLLRWDNAAVNMSCQCVPNSRYGVCWGGVGAALFLGYARYPFLVFRPAAVI
jgi:hypothetical protein